MRRIPLPPACLATLLWCCASLTVAADTPPADTGRSAGAAEQGVEPACAAAGDRGSARFEPGEDGTVTDRRSRLMWMRCAAGQRWDGSGCRGPAARTDWEGASAIAREVNATGSAFFADWRLPRLSELASITQLDCPPPRVDRRMFPDTPPDWFWTDTSRAGEPGGGFAYALSFGSDGVAPISKERMARVRLVRHAD